MITILFPTFVLGFVFIAASQYFTLWHEAAANISADSLHSNNTNHNRVFIFCVLITRGVWNSIALYSLWWFKNHIQKLDMCSCSYGCLVSGLIIFCYCCWCVLIYIAQLWWAFRSNCLKLLAPLLKLILSTFLLFNRRGECFAPSLPYSAGRKGEPQVMIWIHLVSLKNECKNAVFKKVQIIQITWKFEHFLIFKKIF